MGRKKRSTSRKRDGRRTALIAGITLTVVSVFLLSAAVVPAGTGPVGRFVHARFLAPLFNKVTTLPGLYAAAVGIVLLWAQRRVRCIVGLTCLLFVAVIAAELLLSDEEALAFHLEGGHGAYLGFLLHVPITRLIGHVGLTLMLGAVLLAGAFLLVPQKLWLQGWRRLRQRLAAKRAARRSRKARPAKTKEAAARPPRRRTKKERAAVSAGDEAAAEVPRIELNLERYNRQLTKVPTGLFAEHTSFDAALRAGERREEIIEAFAAVDVPIKVGQVKRGPSFEQYEILPGKGVRVAKIKSSIEDVSVRLKQRLTISKNRSRSLVLEVPLAERQVIPCGFLLEDPSDDAMALPVAVGVDAEFQPFSVDLTELPHLLIAGTTGSGKSVFLKTLIASLMYHLTPDEVRLVLVDPKRVEFSVFAASSFCACRPITDFAQVSPLFETLVSEMEQRYESLERQGVSDLKQYNAAVELRRRRPYLVVVVDEFADLLMQNVPGFEDAVIRLAQKARAAGIHLVMATQRPSADVIKGRIKTNIPGRIALSVSSRVDSKIILDAAGAENLNGNGDLICLCPAFRDGVRLQGAYITDAEIKMIIAAKQ
jgi:S-DNA-T family DNA segregation ATPase FtsK/SpoIIIE